MGFHYLRGSQATTSTCLRVHVPPGAQSRIPVWRDSAYLDSATPLSGESS